MYVNKPYTIIKHNNAHRCACYIRTVSDLLEHFISYIQTVFELIAWFLCSCARLAIS